YALELGRAIADGTIQADSLHVALPTSLRGIVARRLNALPPQVREALAAVAALAAPSLALLAPLGASVAEDVELARGRGILELAELAVTLSPPDALAAINRRRITAADDWRAAGDCDRGSTLLEAAISSSPPGSVRAAALAQLAFLRIATGDSSGAESLYALAL